MVVSCQKNDQRVLFYNNGKATDVGIITFYHTEKGRLYLYIKDNDVRNEVYNSKIDSVNFFIKDSVFTGKPQELVLDGHFTTDFIMPLDNYDAKISIDTINGKPLFLVPFVKTKHMDYIKSGFIESTLLK